MINFFKGNLSRTGTASGETSYSRLARKDGDFCSPGAVSRPHVSLTKTCALLLGLLMGASASAKIYDQEDPVHKQLEYTGAHYTVKAHYAKSDHMIAMRDGIKLFTVIYSPTDRSQNYPFLLVRTPYSAMPYGVSEFPPPERMAPSEDFLRDGYIFVFQEVRGTYKSEGEWVSLRPVRKNTEGTDETTDTYDTIDWLIKNVPGNNGRIGQWGISYPGVYTVTGMVKPHPALKAASPQATTFDAFIGDDDHRNGAFNLGDIEWWYMMSIATGPDRKTLTLRRPEDIDFGTPWAYEFFLNAGATDKLNEKYFGGRLTQIFEDLIDHPDYDEYWKSRNVRESLGDIKVPVLNVMGWFDATDPYGALATYQAIEEMNPRNESTLVAGPWSHGGWSYEDGSKLGDMQFGSKTSEYYQKNIVFPFFQYHLKGKGGWSPPEAIVFETGNNRWHRFTQWPPPGVVKKDIYFHEDGRLAFEVPDEENSKAYDSYVSDPFRPVPHTQEIRRNLGTEYMTGDQRYAFTRPDVLTYQTDTLEADITIAGPILVKLFASTSGTDSDWFVKLIDVYPGNTPDEKNDPRGVKMGGYQMLLGYEVMRGKYRNSFSKPERMVPDEVTPISFNIRDKFHTFKKGHKIMVQVQSSWFPLFDRNPQTFTNIYRAQRNDYQKATQRIYRSNASPSCLVLPIVEHLMP